VDGSACWHQRRPKTVMTIKVVMRPVSVSFQVALSGDTMEENGVLCLCMCHDCVICSPSRMSLKCVVVIECLDVDATSVCSLLFRL